MTKYPLNNVPNQIFTKFRLCNYLGTTQSIWLNGSNPQKVGDQTTLEAKIVCQGCRYNPWDVKAKKCKKDNKEFVIYQLKSVGRCPRSYCAGKLRFLSKYSSRTLTQFILAFRPNTIKWSTKIISFFFLCILLSILFFLRFSSFLHYDQNIKEVTFTW